MTYALLALALVAPFVFPYPLVAVLALLAAIPFPFAPVAVGVLVDALYLPPATLPLATLLGAAATLIALLVRHSFKTSIMHA